jgi:hypothetical protein
VNRPVANPAHRRIAAQPIVVRILLANEPSKLRPAAWGVAKDGDAGGTISRISYKGPPSEHAAAPAEKPRAAGR